MDCSMLGLKPPVEPDLKFLIVGLIASSRFQKCKWLVEKLHIYHPTKYAEPSIRGMLDLDWEDYLTKMRRRHGREFWILRKPVAVYLNEEFLGDDKALDKYIAKRYRFEAAIDFREASNKDLIAHFTHQIENNTRKFVFLTIAIQQKVIGSMLFMLYNDLVPMTCENFLKRCKAKRTGYTYRRTNFHRIVSHSWIQCGGRKLKSVEMACENYVIGHDRRGVLSMCNQKRHVDNSTQFLITLEATPWMDYRYVAFGQLVQGADILKQIEHVPTHYQQPRFRIEITNCGEFSLCPKLPEEYVKSLLTPSNLKIEEPDIGNETSHMNLKHYLKGKYCNDQDLRSYLPLSLMPGRVWRYFDDLLAEKTGMEGEEDNFGHVVCRRNLKKHPVW